MIPPPALRQTPLRAEHEAAGARLVPFAGWEMPVSYEGVRPEHLAVRTGCGIFDVSHMGQIGVTGGGAERLLQRLLSNDVAAIDVGGAQYSCLCADDGGILDDVFAYRTGPDEYLIVTNAANHRPDLEHFLEVGEQFPDATVGDLADSYAMIAVQGPRARAIVAELAAGEPPPRMRTAELTIAGVPALVCGTGYTGEAGVEVLIAPQRAPELWRALRDAGAAPAGLGARDTLRLEVCFHLHGNDIGPDRNPIEAGLGWCCKEATGFIGADAVAAAREAGPAEKLVAFTLAERGIPRAGNAILVEQAPIGTVTSGTFSPSLEAGIGMGYVRADHAEPGTAITIDVRGKLRAAEIKPKPLYEKSG